MKNLNGSNISSWQLRLLKTLIIDLDIFALFIL